MPRPPLEEPAFKTNVSKELLHKADGDVIFVWITQGNTENAQEAQRELEELKADPLWSKLNAVQQGRVYSVPYYWVGFGPIAANLVLDDLFEHLVDAPAQADQ
ncbi:MAG: ABC transporter substrate-binding protein [Cyanobacteria bacterium P01_C01_bin.89]